MSTDAMAGPSEPSSTEYSAIWVAYALYAVGAFGFVFGPIVGLIINYARRDVEAAGFIASDHGWLIRTFWWTLAGCLLCLAVIVAGVWPIVGDIVREAIRTAGDVQGFSFGIRWETLFATVGAATAGGLGLVVVWIWNVYRLLRGAFRLAERSAVA